MELGTGDGGLGYCVQGGDDDELNLGIDFGGSGGGDGLYRVGCAVGRLRRWRRWVRGRRRW